MARNAYYKPQGVLFDVMLGVNVSSEFKRQLERAADAAYRTKSDFIRLVLDKGLKAFQDEQRRSREPS